MFLEHRILKHKEAGRNLTGGFLLGITYKWSLFFPHSPEVIFRITTQRLNISYKYLTDDSGLLLVISYN